MQESIFLKSVILFLFIELAVVSDSNITVALKKLDRIVILRIYLDSLGCRNLSNAIVGNYQGVVSVFIF